MKPPKQTIVFRKDLQVRKGKFASQIAHASMKVFFDRMSKQPDHIFMGQSYKTDFTPEMEEWKNGLFTKIVLGCPGIDDIHSLEAIAKERNIPYAVIIDSGLTEFGGVPTITCIALGPYSAEELEDITKNYSLL